MRILVTTGTFHPEPGGPPTYLYHLLPELLSHRHNIQVLTYGDAPSDDYPYPVLRISRQQSLPARLLAYARHAWHMAGSADVLFTQAYTLPILPVVLLRRRPLVMKIVSDSIWELAVRRGWIAPDVDVNTFQKMPKPLQARLARLQQLIGLRLARSVIVPSAHVAALVEGWGVPPEKIHIITNAAPPERNLPPDAIACRAELGLPAEVPLLVSVGRLTAVKGFDVAMQALSQLPTAHFAIVGDGEDREKLAALAGELGLSDRVHFLGRREHREVMIAIRAADVFVLSSHTEGLSHVLLEALSEGVPAVATMVGGNPEVLTDGLNGLLVPPNDPAKLAQAIQRVLDDSSLAADLGAGARHRSADFSWDQLVTRTANLLVSAVSGKG